MAGVWCCAGGGAGGRGRRSPLWWAVFRSCTHLWTGALGQGLQNRSTRMGGAKTTAHMRSVSPSAIATRCQSEAERRGTRVVKTVRKTLERSRQPPTTLSPSSRQRPTTLSPTAPTCEAPSAPTRSATALERSASKNQALLARRGAARATTVRGVEYRAVPGTSKGKGRTNAALGASHRARARARDAGSISQLYAPLPGL